MNMHVKNSDGISIIPPILDQMTEYKFSGLYQQNTVDVIHNEYVFYIYGVTG